VCSLEVPDLAADIATFGDDVTAFLVSVDPQEMAAEFLETMGAVQTCLLDEDRAVYSSYDTTVTGVGGTPFPLRVVIDREGVIRWIDTDVDSDALREAVEDALER